MKRQKNKMPENNLIGHLRELLFRSLICIFCLIISGVVVFFFYEPILNLLRSPLDDPLYYNNPAGSLTLIMRICFISALTITIPIIIYNIIMFIRPAFSEALNNKRVYFTTGLSSILAISGAAFAYLCILPGTLEFFSGFKVNGLSALISADSYLDFVINMITAFVLIFQLPLIIILADSINKIPPKKLLKNEKWVILGSVIIVIITPFNYDLITSLFVAVPIIALYNLSIIIIALRHLGQKRQAKKHATTTQSSYIIKPIINTPVAQSLAGDFIDNKPEVKPIYQVRPRQTSMDIVTHKKPVTLLPKPVVTQKPITIKPYRVHYFSDISRRPHVNHALTV